jgi:anti-sigma factor RsiW
MNCQDFKNQIFDWALDELSADAREHLEQHAAECAACAVQWKKVSRLPDVMRAGWGDEEIPRSIVFAPEATAPSPTSVWQWLAAAPRWANWSMATAASVVFLFAALSFARVQVQYDRGHFAVAWGNAMAPAVASPASTERASFNPAEMERIITSKYSELSAKDRQDYAAMLDRFAQQSQVQRSADLQKIGEAFDQVKNVMWKEMQHNDAIVQYAAQRIVTNSKN